MAKIYNSSGDEMGELTLTAKQKRILDSGENLVVIFHTPQLLHNALGMRSGSIVLVKDGEDIKTLTPVVTAEFLALQAAIKAAREPN